MKTVFRFTFGLTYHEDQEIPDDFKDMEEINAVMIGTSSEKLDDDTLGIMVGEMEEYGIHEWLSYPNEEIYCVGGFYSDEILAVDIHPVLEIWREKLKDLSVNLSEVKFFQCSDELDDKEVYLKYHEL